MSDIWVQYDNRTEQVNSVLVPPQENRRSLQSNGGMCGSREDSMELEDTSTIPKSRVRCGKVKLCTLISSAGVCVLVGLVIGYCAAKTLNKAKAEVSLSGLASSQTGSIELSNGGVDLRINPDTSVCDGSSCVQCKAEAPSPHNITSNPFSCGEDQNVKNSSCYLCNGECKTPNDLQGRTSIMCGGRPKSIISCCIISQMGNLGNVCGVGGEYNCYEDGSGRLTPMCICPRGQSGDGCQTSTTDKLNCKCYKPDYKFCGQENIAECNSMDTDVTQCHMVVDRRGESHNCICNKADDGESDDNYSDSCSIPRTDALTNGTRTNDSTKLFQDFLLYIVLLAICLVEKT
ncbi:uncharacterized protein LOC128555644 isoform X2 [Mercenaria mercenaria]|uniref:uncharacterized protein LOC128555644 isoform X2 n=1 Tax=Mercenaria mercenaria TaxID=6596 RepID=UPI00234F0E34|nr:uncharacterized protein LOC128555644 isoform X2 [Mercenaria mercenaria]